MKQLAESKTVIMVPDIDDGDAWMASEREKLCACNVRYTASHDLVSPLHSSHF